MIIDSHALFDSYLSYSKSRLATDKRVFIILNELEIFSISSGVTSVFYALTRFYFIFFFSPEKVAVFDNPDGWEEKTLGVNVFSMSCSRPVQRSLLIESMLNLIDCQSARQAYHARERKNQNQFGETGARKRAEGNLRPRSSWLAASSLAARKMAPGAMFPDSAELD